MTIFVSSKAAKLLAGSLRVADSPRRPSASASAPATHGSPCRGSRWVFAGSA